MKVFVAGPRALKSLALSVENRFSNIIKNNITVLVGDANGIDKITQQYFFSHNYSNVIVYASNGKVRNNIGGWPVEKVMVEDEVKGFDFYAAKDMRMAEDADYGFMIWNGKSKGTLNNIINLVNRSKKVLLFFTPHKKFYTVNSIDDVQMIALACGDDVSETFAKLNRSARKASLNTSLNKSYEQLTLL